MNGSPQRIVVSRTDRLGDVVLTLPLLGALREAHPAAELCFLGREYVRDVVQACAHVDRFVPWPDPVPATAKARAALLAALDADAIVHVFPRAAVAFAARRAGIACRVGTSRRWFHWLTCTDRVRLSRKRSTLHEAQLNIRMGAPLLDRADHSLEDVGTRYGLTRTAMLPARWSALLDARRFNLLISPLTGGSAPPWPLDRWRALIDALDPESYRVFVVGSAAEGTTLRPWLATCPPHVTDATGQTLGELASFTRAADGFIAASTGPAHLAAALGARTLGLYPTVSSGVPGRWRPVGPRATIVTAPESAPERSREAHRHDIGGIGVAVVTDVVERWARER
ncbi:MAG: glycosyltransferase family 9 protein [Proteobacteria bacterium]|nr:glycosyltransferase family 9 protein [Pseudomonadota bacterium]